MHRFVLFVCDYLGESHVAGATVCQFSECRVYDRITARMPAKDRKQKCITLIIKKQWTRRAWAARKMLRMGPKTRRCLSEMRLGLMALAQRLGRRTFDQAVVARGFDSRPGRIRAPWSTQPSIHPGKVNRVSLPALLAGVKAGRAPLCRAASMCAVCRV